MRSSWITLGIVSSIRKVVKIAEEFITYYEGPTEKRSQHLRTFLESSPTSRHIFAFPSSGFLLPPPASHDAVSRDPTQTRCLPVLSLQQTHCVVWDRRLSPGTRFSGKRSLLLARVLSLRTCLWSTQMHCTLVFCQSTSKMNKETLDVCITECSRWEENFNACSNRCSAVIGFAHCKQTTTSFLKTKSATKTCVGRANRCLLVAASVSACGAAWCAATDACASAASFHPLSGVVLVSLSM